MYSKSKKYFFLLTLIFLLCIFSQSSSKLDELVKEQVLASALSPQSIWNQDFLDQNNGIKDKIRKFERGELCQNLKKLNNAELSYDEIRIYLKKMGFLCFLRPLMVDPKASPLMYLKKDNTITGNPQDPNVAYQEICYERAHPECAIRLKMDGFPRNKRSQPHSTKAILLNKNGDPGSFDNEAFKISIHGQAIPKGPNAQFGLKKCPYASDEQCERWVDAIMEQAHPLLKKSHNN